MPLLVNKLIYTIVPQKLPMLIRPLANLVFGGLSSQFVDPGLKANARLVRYELHPIVMFDC